MAPDPERLGGLAWTRRTGGALTPRERRRLLGAIVRQQGVLVAGLVRLATGQVPIGARNLATTDFAPPDSALARAAEQACAEQPPVLVGHGYRTWAFGSALAALDRASLEPESFYVASLLHDHGLEAPVAGEDFTLRAAERAQRCVREAGAPDGAGEAVADAITVHATPGATVARDGALGVYVGAGAVLDLIGLRAGHLPRAFRADVDRAHPRAGITREILPLIQAEAAANPAGRFALLHRCGFGLAIRAAPVRPR